MNISNKEYDELVKKASPPSNISKTLPWAFVSGGTICALGQMIWDGFLALGVKPVNCPLVVSCTLIIAAALLTGLGVFDNIAKHAGAGTLVPITGFSNSVSSPALEFKSEGFILGTGAKMFIIAGPVIVYGVAASVVYGLIIWLFKLY